MWNSASEYNLVLPLLLVQQNLSLIVSTLHAEFHTTVHLLTSLDDIMTYAFPPCFKPQDFPYYLSIKLFQFTPSSDKDSLSDSLSMTCFNYKNIIIGSFTF
jgi:hypothetical protein